MASPEKSKDENIKLLIITVNDMADKLNMMSETISNLEQKLKESEGK
jgi:hypothetical protein